jgi:hypothetical protein
MKKMELSGGGWNDHTTRPKISQNKTIKYIHIYIYTNHLIHITTYYEGNFLLRPDQEQPNKLDYILLSTVKRWIIGSNNKQMHGNGLCAICAGFSMIFQKNEEEQKQAFARWSFANSGALKTRSNRVQ